MIEIKKLFKNKKIKGCVYGDVIFLIVVILVRGDIISGNNEVVGIGIILLIY